MEAEQRHITTTSDSATSLQPPVNGQKLRPMIGMMTSSSDKEGVHEEKHFPFLELPAELRVLVYEHLLVAEGPWRLYIARMTHKNTSCLYANIIATCKIVRREATSIFYGHNEFILEWEPQDLPRFINEISESAQYVTAVKVDRMVITKKKTKGIFVLLKKFRALSKLTVGYSLYHYHGGTEAFAKTIGPLARMLYKNQQKKQDVKARDVLDGLHLTAEQVSKYNEHADARQAEGDSRAAAFEKQVKDLLRATFR